MHFTKKAWLIWGVATIFAGFQLFIGVLLGATAKELSIQLSIKTADVSGISALYFLVYGLMQIPAGIIIDRYSIKKILSIGSVVAVICLLMIGFSKSAFVVCLLVVVIGIFLSFNFIGALVLASRWFPPKMFSVVTGMVAGISGLVSSVLCFLVISILPKIGENTIITASAIGVIISLLIFLVIEDYPGMAEEHSKVKNKESLTDLVYGLYKSVCNIQILLSALIVTLVTGSFLAFITFWFFQYQELYKNTPMLTAILNILVLVGISIGAPTLGWISEKMQMRKPVGYIICIGLLILEIVVLQPKSLPFITLFPIFFLLGFFANNVSIGFSLVKENSEPGHIGTALAFANTLIFLGMSFLQLIPYPILHYIQANKTQIPDFHITTDISQYSLALSIYPLSIFLALILHIFIKETYCKPRD